MIKAIYDNVIVKVVYKDTVAGGNIVLPDRDDVRSFDKDYYGEVISIGPDFPHKLEIGDMVIYPRNEGIRLIDKKGNEYWMLKEKWVLAVIK